MADSNTTTFKEDGGLDFERLSALLLLLLILVVVVVIIIIIILFKLEIYWQYVTPGRSLQMID